MTRLSHIHSLHRESDDVAAAIAPMLHCSNRSQKMHSFTQSAPSAGSRWISAVAAIGTTTIFTLAVAASINLTA